MKVMIKNYDHYFEPDMQDTAGEAGRSHKRCILMDPQHGAQKQDDQHEHTFSSYVRIGMLS